MRVKHLYSSLLGKVSATSRVLFLALLTCLVICLLLVVALLSILLFPHTPTGQGRWPPTLSLVLLDVSSIKMTFSSSQSNTPALGGFMGFPKNYVRF